MGVKTLWPALTCWSIFPNTIKALLEWDRLVRPGGTIFMIVPHKERTFDKQRARTSLQHLIEDYLCDNKASHDDPNGHDHCWVTEDIVALVNWMVGALHVQWEIVEAHDVDDKVGNGFTIVIKKKENRVRAKGRLQDGIAGHEETRRFCALR